MAFELRLNLQRVLESNRVYHFKLVTVGVEHMALPTNIRLGRKGLPDYEHSSLLFAAFLKKKKEFYSIYTAKDLFKVLNYN
jgi:hypothetical protein